MDGLRFRLPLVRAILDDPAFSSDPRSHPHFPLADARSYKILPPKSPPRSSPSSSPDASTSSSATLPSRGSPTTSSPSPSPTSPVFNLISKPHRPLPIPIPIPEILPRPRNTNTILKPVPTNIPRKARMKAFVRRLTTRHNLDRIDELDETDPFGTSYHHDGRYEAIGSNLRHPSLPCNTVRNIHPKRPSDRHPLRRQSAHRVPYVEMGLSLHLEPGQILQPNTIYNSPAMATPPAQFLPHPSTPSITTRSDPSRCQSLPNPRTRPREESSPAGFQDDVQNSHAPPLHAPREHYLGDYALNMPNNPSLHNDRVAVPYTPAHFQTQKTIFPPPRYESKLYGSPSRSPQRTPSPSFNSTSPKTLSTENSVPALRRPDSKHKAVHSLDSSHTIISTFTQPSSNIQNKPSDPPRKRHLPKRLVMPAPLQPQQSQQHCQLPPTESSTWRDEYLDVHALEGARFEGKSTMYSEEPRLLRKKSSAFPAKSPIPGHVPASQDDIVPITRSSLSRTANEVEGTKERIHRRRLSKRKNEL